MILSLVAEGRTVVLSSHLLDEVERTCDAVAIVDRGNVIRQGPISEAARRSLVRACRSSAPSPTGPAACSTAPPSEPTSRPGRTGSDITLPAGTDARRHRRDQPAAGRRRHLGVPAPGDPGLARVVVPAGHEPTGGPNDDRPDVGAPAPVLLPLRARRPRSDHRGSWIPTWGMITTRFMELRKRRGLMIALIAVIIGIPTVFLASAYLARRRPQVLRPGRRLRHLHHPRRRRDVRLRLHRGGHRRLHGRVDRPHRRHVPPPGGDRPLPAGAVPGPDPGRAGHHHRHRGGRLHHRLRRLRVRRADAAQLRRRERARRPVAGRPRELGRRPRRRGHLQLQLPRRPGIQPPPNVPAAAIDRAAARHVIQTGRRDGQRPGHRVAGPDPGVRGHGRQPELRGLLLATSCPRRSR